MTSVNETEFEPADFLMDPETEPQTDEKQNRETEMEKSGDFEKSGKSMSGPGKSGGTLGGQTGWEGWDDQDEWKERVKVELDEKMKVEESALPIIPTSEPEGEVIPVPEVPSSLEVPSRNSQEVETDTEGGYETAREGYTTETEGHATETEAFFSADEDINEANDIITQVDMKPDLQSPEGQLQGPEDPDSTPRNSPRNSPLPIVEQPEQISGMV